MTITSSHSTQTAGCIICEPSKILRGLSYASKVLSETAKKVAFIASIYLMKAAQITRTGLIEAWSFTKIAGNHTAQFAKYTGNALLVFLRIVADKTVKFSIASAQVAKNVAIVAGIYIGKGAVLAKDGLKVAWEVTKVVGSKTLEAVKSASLVTMALLKTFGQYVLQISYQVGQLFAKYSVKFAYATAELCSQAKAGLAQGFQVARLFFGTHQKETAIAGCAIAVGASVGYIAHRVFAGSKKADAQAQAV